MSLVTPLTPSRFGASTTQAHSAQHLSMADSLPSVDFGFVELRDRMSSFTARFDDFVTQGRKRVLDERNAFRMSRAGMQETRRNKRQAIAELENKSITHASTVAKEALETEELELAITSLKTEKEQQEQRREELQAEVDRVKAQIRQRREGQQAYQSALDEQARDDIPELRAWEMLLGWRIEGTDAGSEKLRFVFDIDGREAWFDMDFASQQGQIVEAKPKVSVDDVAALEQALHHNRDMAALLKGMRDLFVKALPG